MPYKKDFAFQCYIWYFECKTTFLYIILVTHFRMARILVWMSWWVDSAVSAALLIQQGHEVIAGFMKNYADESNPHCQTKQDRDTALKVSQYLGIKTFVIFDFRQEYDELIVQYIYKSYEAGLTPNPDVFCNSEVKFSMFLEQGLSLWCDAIAMGHYARIHTTNEQHQKYLLLKGVDPQKDQSYFLSRLNQFQLSKSLFPIWHLQKSQVRSIAHELGLPNADRKDSQGLCFIGKVSIKDFVSKQLPKMPWPIYDVHGNYLGEHDGIQFYTIGQRHGFWWWWWIPLYIVSKDKTHNTLIVGSQDCEWLFSQRLWAHNRHRIHDAYELPKRVSCKIRYRQEDQSAVLESFEGDSISVFFENPQRAISSWQIVVAYDGDVCIGSWIIS